MSIPPGQPRRDLVVLSHLRWDGVRQRPQHLVSRLAAWFDHTWFVEEPSPRDEGSVRLHTIRSSPVTRVLVDVADERDWLPFGAPAHLDHAELVAAACASPQRPVVWLYTPLALPIARRLDPAVLVYDVMDDLAAFSGAPEATRFSHLQALAEADIVFTGGHTIHEGVQPHRRRAATTLCFPSGVETAHFAHPRVPHRTPVAGYVGVIDERLDLELVAALAERLPSWRIRMVGPVSKIDPALLPQAPNIEYLGKQAYAELPRILAGFDVALMPFALNDATKSISPTKTLEYLAAGLPTVSTPVRDVVRDHADVVRIATDAAGFARACDDALAGRFRVPAHTAASLLGDHEWDTIAARMATTILTADEAAGSATEEAASA